MWTHPFFKRTHARIWAKCRCPSTRPRPCTRVLKWASGPSVHTVFVSYVAIHGFIIIAKLMFLKKWRQTGRNGVTIYMYTVAYRLLTALSENHFGPVPMQWFPGSVNSPWEMKQNVRISRASLANWNLITNASAMEYLTLFEWYEPQCSWRTMLSVEL